MDEMNTNDDDLLAALRRAENPADRRLAELLASAPGKEGRSPHGKEGRTPRASDALAAFLAAAISGVSPLTDTDDQSVIAHDTYRLEPVLLAQTPTRSSQMKPVSAFSRVLKLSLLAKIVLGATLAIGSVGAVASTTVLGQTGDDIVIASPATDDDGALEVDDEREAHVALAADEAAAQVAADAARDAARAAAKAAKAAAKKAAAEKRAAAAAAGTETDTDDADDQGEDGDDQGEDGDDQGEDENDSDDGDESDSDDADEPDDEPETDD
ncbi:MAG: hypothetical protein ABJA93_08145 [Sporichthyaceae bacterium]